MNNMAYKHYLAAVHQDLVATRKAVQFMLDSVSKHRCEPFPDCTFDEQIGSMTDLVNKLTGVIVFIEGETLKVKFKK